MATTFETLPPSRHYCRRHIQVPVETLIGTPCREKRRAGHRAAWTLLHEGSNLAAVGP
jgi:hypothetical protein